LREFLEVTVALHGTVERQERDARRPEGAQGRHGAREWRCARLPALDLGEQRGQCALEAELQDLAVVDRRREEIAEGIR